MSDAHSSWAIVLAAGEGSRLRDLTTDPSGRVVPKQFCSLHGGRSLLDDALARAGRVVPRKRVLVVVAAEQRAFWSRILRGHPAENVIVQPRNRGTAAGIVLPLLHVLERDPRGRVVVVPSDHHVEDEAVLVSSMRLALDSLDEPGEWITMLGIEPDSPDCGYGWIVPVPRSTLVRPVARFVEKPSPSEACELLAHGAVWSSFVLAADGQALLGLCERRLPALVACLRAAFAAPAAERDARLARAYEHLESADFSRDVLQGSEERLCLEVVPPCGWTDLGTPERVASCLAALTAPTDSASRRPDAFADLATAIGAALHGPRSALAHGS
jgi:mannose-1-phosphate guanylyltransferase